MCRKKPEIRAFERENKEYIRRSLKLVRLMGMLWPTLELMLGCAWCWCCGSADAKCSAINVDPRNNLVSTFPESTT